MNRINKNIITAVIKSRLTIISRLFTWSAKIPPKKERTIIGRNMLLQFQKVPLSQFSAKGTGKVQNVRWHYQIVK